MAGRADSQTGTQCGVVPRYVRYVLYCAVQYRRTPYFQAHRVVALLCVVCPVRQRGRPPTDLSRQTAQTARSVRAGERSRVEPLHRQTRPQRTGTLCCARVEHWSFSPCPPHRPQAWPGELGESIARHRELELLLANGGTRRQLRQLALSRFAASCATVTAHHSLLLHDSCRYRHCLSCHAPGRLPHAGLGA